MLFICCGKPDTVECLIEIQRRHHCRNIIQHSVELSLLLVISPVPKIALL